MRNKHLMVLSFIPSFIILLLSLNFQYEEFQLLNVLRIIYKLKIIFVLNKQYTS